MMFTSSEPHGKKVRRVDRKKIAEKLVAMRGKKTQAEVAKSVGISKSSLAMYETAQRSEIGIGQLLWRDHSGYILFIVSSLKVNYLIRRPGWTKRR